jgi:endonuclease G, mitochondrial
MNRQTANLISKAVPFLFQSFLKPGGPSPWAMFVAGGVAGAVVAEAIRHEEEQKKAFKGAGKKGAGPQPSPAISDPRVVAITGGAAPSRFLHRVSDNFVAEFDPLTKNPRWVCERLDRETLQNRNASRSGVNFKEEPGLPPALRSRLSDYAGWRYDRGHCAPAANHRSSDVAMADTFYLSNISPQVGPGFNRNYWARFEKFARDCAFRRGVENCYVVTGPVFAPEWDDSSASKAPPNNVGENNNKKKDEVPYQPEVVVDRPYASNGRWVYKHEAIGDALHWVAVPSHFFKVIVCCDSDNKPISFGAFLMPNDVIPASAKLEDFVVPLSVVESVSGLQFFRDLLPAAGVASATSASAPGSKAVGDLSPAILTTLRAELDWDLEEASAAFTSNTNNGGKGKGRQGRKKDGKTGRGGKGKKAEGNSDDDGEGEGAAEGLTFFDPQSSILRANIRRLLTKTYPGPWSVDALPLISPDGEEGRSATLRHLCTRDAGGCILPPENWFVTLSDGGEKKQERAGGESNNQQDDDNDGGQRRGASSVQAQKKPAGAIDMAALIIGAALDGAASDKHHESSGGSTSPGSGALTTNSGHATGRAGIRA